MTRNRWEKLIMIFCAIILISSAVRISIAINNDKIKEPVVNIPVMKEETTNEVEEKTTNEVEEKTTTIEPTTEKVTTKKVNTTKQQRTAGSYKITHYGPDCKGCSGTTASGYNVKNTIWYDDWQYGRVRIVATSKNIPLYSIIRLNDYGDGNVLAIVLDRGVSGNVIDLLVSSEKQATQLGIKKNASVDILRRGK